MRMARWWCCHTGNEVVTVTADFTTSSEERVQSFREWSAARHRWQRWADLSLDWLRTVAVISDELHVISTYKKEASAAYCKWNWQSYNSQPLLHVSLLVAALPEVSCFIMTDFSSHESQKACGPHKWIWNFLCPRIGNEGMWSNQNCTCLAQLLQHLHQQCVIHDKFFEINKCLAVSPLHNFGLYGQ